MLWSPANLPDQNNVDSACVLLLCQLLNQTLFNTALKFLFFFYIWLLS